MFFQKAKPNGKIYAPLSGQVIPVTEADDAVFADKILGDGVAIMPTDSTVVAPINGTVINISDTLHAIGMEGTDGIELLLHVGLDTVELGSTPFKCHVKPGDKVKVGQLLLTVDFKAIKSAGYKAQTPVVITNMDTIRDLRLMRGVAVAGKTCILEYQV